MTLSDLDLLQKHLHHQINNLQEYYQRYRKKETEEELLTCDDQLKKLHLLKEDIIQKLLKQL